ncbi:MAG: hypothetical protein ABI672_07005 [Vicinamibacteria bacterium]
MVMVPLIPPASLLEVARIMRLVAEMPRRRRRPESGDLEGPYDEWFDGGACRYLTNMNTYDLSDGSSAWRWTTTLLLSGGVKLASGETVNFSQEPAVPREQPAKADATLVPSSTTGSDSCVVCGRMIVPGSTVQITERGPAHYGCVE